MFGYLTTANSVRLCGCSLEQPKHDAPGAAQTRRTSGPPRTIRSQPANIAESSPCPAPTADDPTRA